MLSYFLEHAVLFLEACLNHLNRYQLWPQLLSSMSEFNNSEKITSRVPEEGKYK